MPDLPAGGLGGYGATFSGGYLVRTNPTELNGLSAITIQALVQLSSIAADKPIFIAGPNTGSDFGLHLRFRVSDGRLVFTIRVGANSTTVESPDDVMPAIGTPMLVAATWTSGQAPKLYAGGKIVDLAVAGTALTGVTNATLGAASSEALIGYNRATGNRWNGQIADLMVSARVLTEGHLQTQELNYLTPRDSYGVGAVNRASEANLSPVLPPIFATATVGVMSEVDPALLAYEGDAGQVKTLEALTGTGGGTSNIVGGRAQFTPSAVGEARRIATVRDNGTPMKRSLAPIIWMASAAPTPDKWWLISTLERDGRHWAGGPGYYQSSRNTWVQKCGKWTAVTESIKRRNNTGDQDWDGITGGPATDSLTNPSIKNGSQVDFTNDLDSAFRQASPNSAFMCAVMAAWPRTLSTSGNKNERRVYTEILGGTRDREYALLGARLKKKFLSYGWSNLDLLVLRINHECNGSNIYQVFPETTDLYRRAMERAYEKMRDGAGHRLRIIQSVERSKDIGRLQDWMPQSRYGGIDSVNVSWHPGPQITIHDFYDNYDKFLAKWNNSSYGVLEGQAANVALGLPDVAPEYAPKYDLDNDTPPCEASAMANRQFAKYLRQLARDRRLIFETIYNQTSLRSDAYLGNDAPGKAEWAKMVAEIPDLWRGASKGTVPKLDTNPDAVTMSGTGLTYNPFPRCTANGAVEISRIVSVSGGISARVTGTGPNGRVEIDKNGAAPGRKKLFVEMCLTNMKHYLTDVEVEVTVT